MGTSDEDIERVLAHATTIAFDRKRAKQWLNEPLPTFGGKTPLELTAAGRTQDVLNYLDSVAPGFIG